MEQPSLPTLNALLEQSGVDPNSVLVMRHRPWETSLNLVFDSIASEHSQLFDCYQSSHGPRTEAALKKAKYLASFIRHETGTALFIGLYSVDGFCMKTAEEIQSRPLHRELVAMGMSGDFSAQRSDQIADFALTRTQWAGDWSQRLIVKWPGADRAWYQWAGRNRFEIVALAAEPVLGKAPPPWHEMCPNWAELKVLPKQWRDALRHWRGIYLITDLSDGSQYVGAAYGNENLLQRWVNYAETGHGGNKHLRLRNPETFQFAILELVSPTASPEEVIELERSWKARLASRWPNGLNDN
jgi:hypothetical protein